MTKLILMLVIGFVLGMKFITWAYDPELLENKAIELAQASYYKGCADSAGSDCNAKAVRHKEDIGTIIKRRLSVHF